jgi:hypothetical protein
MGRFRRFLSEALLKEVFLHRHLYTWSNERSHPTMEHINRAFMTANWEEIFPNHGLQSMAFSSSEHVTLLLRTDEACTHKKRFHFRVFLAQVPRVHGHDEACLALPLACRESVRAS